MSVRYAVIFEQAESNWAAYVPDLPGCITTGKTLAENKPAGLPLDTASAISWQTMECNDRKVCAVTMGFI